MNENKNTELHDEMTVGEILRNARTTGRRKREIQTISKQLCIREEFLQALEDGNYNVIPENVYILGFARNYAMELGLDPDEIVNKLKRELGLVADHQENKDEADGAVICKDENCSVKQFRNILNKSMKYVRRNWKWFLIGAGIFVVILALVIFLLVPSSDDQASVGQKSDSEQVMTVPEPQYKVEVRERFGTENADTASVILQATQESWVKVEDARGNTVFSRVLVPGDIYFVPSGDGYTAVFGNAGGVDVWVDGQLAPKQGADHVRVADISMSPEKLLPNAVTE